MTCIVSDYVTIKYDADGRTLWVATYTGPGRNADSATGLTLDEEGNVYVTGTSYGSASGSDYATIKYDSQGHELWVARYNGPDNSSDYATSIQKDGVGNVYVTGTSYGSGSGYDYATIKYDPEGHEIWTARYTGPGNASDWANALAVDDAGAVYVTGSSVASEQAWDYDYATVKYDKDGHELWVARYNDLDNWDDAAIALAVDGLGNVHVTGSGWGINTMYDFVTIKYDSEGHELWVARYNGPANRVDRAQALALDASGNVYVTGYSETGSVPSSWDYATVKYDPGGRELWTARYNGPGNCADLARAIAVDGSGNAYVTGESDGTCTYNYDYATIKYDPEGREVWASRYNGPGNGAEMPHGIAVDNAGNIYVTGESSGGTGSGNDYATIKYDPRGVQVWVAQYNGPGAGPGCRSESAHAIAADDAGYVYVTGESYGAGTSLDYATVKYTQQEAPGWTAASMAGAATAGSVPNEVAGAANPLHTLLIPVLAVVFWRAALRRGS